MASAATRIIIRTYQQPYRPARLRDAAVNANAAYRDRTDHYNEFIWSLARKFTNSPEEAEAAVVEMQSDIKRCAERGLSVESNEDRLIARIAWRRLLNFLR